MASENVWVWSPTAANNDDADSGISWPEGMAANAVNNSARGMMAAVAKFVADQGGALTSAGTQPAYTLTTTTTFAAYADGQALAFVCHSTNAAGAATINVDGLGAKDLKKITTAGEEDLDASDLVANGHYLIQYDASADGGSGAWIVLNPATLGGIPNSSLADMTAKTIKARKTNSTGAPEDATITEVLDFITGTAAQGDILYRGSSAMARLAPGTSGFALTTGGAAANPAWTRLVGKQCLPIMAGSMVAATTNGPSWYSVEATTNKNMFQGWAFDSSTSESVQFWLPMPKNWNEGTVTFVPEWFHEATTTNFGVVWELSAVAVSDGESMDAAFGTGQTSTDTGGNTKYKYFGPESSAITIAGSPAAYDCVNFKIARLPANGSDTLAVDAVLMGIKLFITTDTMTDD